MTKNCTCPDWDVGMRQIRAQQTFCSLQSAGPKYDGPIFKYCPWCGSLLTVTGLGAGRGDFLRKK